MMPSLPRSCHRSGRCSETPEPRPSRRCWREPADAQRRAFWPPSSASEHSSFATIGVGVQLKDALNVVWDVEESEESGLWHFARNYVLSFAAVLALGFLLLVSLLVTAALAATG